MQVDPKAESLNRLVESQNSNASGKLTENFSANTFGGRIDR
jgi:hypothetical protein